MNHRQLQVIEYLREENRVLREQLGGRRVRLNDNQRRRLAVKAKALGRTALAEVASIVTPETLLAWHTSGPHEAWIAADPFRGGVNVLITGPHAFERALTFAVDDDPAVIAERVRETMED